MIVRILLEQMAEALVLLPTVMALLRKIPEAVQGAVDLKRTLRERYCDYASILEPLESNPDVVAAKGITPELKRLNELFSQVAGVTHHLDRREQGFVRLPAELADLAGKPSKRTVAGLSPLLAVA